jgi:hypothetical protein
MDIVFDLLVAQLFPEDPHTTGNAAPHCLLPSCTQELWCLPSETQLYLIRSHLYVSDHVSHLVVARLTAEDRHTTKYLKFGVEPSKN